MLNTHTHTSRAETDSNNAKCSSLTISPGDKADEETGQQILVLSKRKPLGIWEFNGILLTAAANLSVISMAMMPGREMFGGGGMGGSRGSILISSGTKLPK